MEVSRRLELLDRLALVVLDLAASGFEFVLACEGTQAGEHLQGGDATSRHYHAHLITRRTVAPAGPAGIGVDPPATTGNYGGGAIDEPSTLRAVADRAAFRRILCAVDNDAGSNETVRQAVWPTGPQAEQIAEVARPEVASLLVVGSCGLGRAQRLGSIGERLAHEAPCSVLVARPS
jgi:nucleotide-binding universal stress UspA family protein